MPWWGWIILGALLLGAELLGVDAAFYLLFLGVAALLTGFLDLAGVNLPLWGEWLVFAVLSVLAMVLFRKRLYQKFRGVDVDYPSGPVGEHIVLEATLPPGATHRQSFHGSEWTVSNGGQATLQQGQRARILRAESLTLIVSE